MCRVADRNRELHYYVDACHHEKEFGVGSVCAFDRLEYCPLADWDEDSGYYPADEAEYDCLPERDERGRLAVA